MGSYENFEQIDYDLKRLNLEREIALEELKLVRSDFQDKLKPLNIIASFVKFAGKYGAMYFFKKIF